MSANPGFPGINDPGRFGRSLRSRSVVPHPADPHLHAAVVSISELERHTAPQLSAWSGSGLKRVFDVCATIAVLPVALPAILLIGLAVRLTSAGPVLLCQRFSGRDGKRFPIYRFRTVPFYPERRQRSKATTTVNQRFTAVGPFLRSTGLDKLPQLMNVLRGEMSLVGPTPRMVRTSGTRLACRPGIAGRSALLFSREHDMLAAVPDDQRDTYYQQVVQPLKQSVDEDYMSHATFASDLRLLWRSLIRDADDLSLAELPLRQSNHAAAAASARMANDWSTRVPASVMVQNSVPLTQPWQQG